MDKYYTDERNAQILISLMKSHGIKRVVVSPGTTNVCFVASIQQDSFFLLYSSVDERSAAYIACGLAAESGEPVALSCTGATASRNYMSGLTEAYYRKLPILVITSSRKSCRIGHNIDQVTDRTLLPRDVAKLSVQMPLVHDEESEWACMINANKAILELNHHGMGPTHINLETNYSNLFNVKELPITRSINRFLINDELPELNVKNVVIMVGAHVQWTQKLTKAVDSFCENYNGVVLCDHTSNYKGKYSFLPNIVTIQRNFISAIKNVDIMIHIGDISSSDYYINMKSVWRVNPDGEIRDTYKKLEYVFEMEENIFFEIYNDKVQKKKSLELYNACISERRELLNKLPEFPFSNIWIASKTASLLPENSILHLGIRNSLRSWNYFDVPNSVLSFSNTGGFGIDGCMSSVIGASICNENKIYFCILGDLAFFYDMNALGNRHIKNNLRIMVINNGTAMEMKFSNNITSKFGEYTDMFLAASGHYGNKSKVLVKHFSQDLGFEYFSASNKKEYMENYMKFIDPVLTNKPILFEVFTEAENEEEAFQLISNIKTTPVQKTVNHIKDFARQKMGNESFDKLKDVLKGKR